LKIWHNWKARRRAKCKSESIDTCYVQNLGTREHCQVGYWKEVKKIVMIGVNGQRMFFNFYISEKKGED
jgi:hypothetical protein